MANLPQIDTTGIFAQAYYSAALAGANMLQAANALETIREAVSSGKPIQEVYYDINDQLGQADLQRLAPALLELRRAILDPLVAQQIERLQSFFERDPETGWKKWLQVYMKSLADEGWMNSYCRLIAHQALAYTPAGAPSVEKIRQYTDYIYYGRWPEAYDWFLFLSEQDLTAEQKARMLAVAAEIQLYHFMQPTPARNLLEKASELASKDQRVMNVWGEFYLVTEKPEDARKYFELAIVRAPYLADGFANLGDYYANTGNLDTAANQYEQAIKNAPGMVDGYRQLTELQSKLTFTPELDSRLQGLLERMLLLADNPVDPWINVGSAYRTLGIVGKAEECFRAAITLDAADPRGYSWLGYTLLDEAGLEEDEKRRKELIQQAEEQFTRLIELAPGAIQSNYWGMMTSAILQKEYGAALDWLAKTRGFHPEWESYLDATEGELLRLQGSLETAEAKLMRSLEREPVNPLALSSLDNLSMDFISISAEAAMRTIESWRKLAGESGEANYQNRVGNINYYYEEYAKAGEHYRQAIAANPGYDVYHSNLALALENTRTPGQRLAEMEEAIVELQRALELSPKDEDYLLRLPGLQAQHSFIRSYGERALEFAPKIDPIQVLVEESLWPFLLSEDQVNLSEPTLKRIDRMKSQVAARFRVDLPGVFFTYLTDENPEPGAYRIDLAGQVQENGRVNPVKKKSLEQLYKHLQRLLENNLYLLFGYEDAYRLLSECESEACSALRASPAGVVRMMRYCRERLQRGESLEETQNMAETVLKSEQQTAR